MKITSLALLIGALTVAPPALAQGPTSERENIERIRILQRQMMMMEAPVPVGGSQLQETLRRRRLLQRQMAGEGAIPGGVVFAALSVEKIGSAVQLKGSVEFRTEAMVLTADEAEYNTETGEIFPRGNVRVKLLTKKP